LTRFASNLLCVFLSLALNGEAYSGDTLFIEALFNQRPILCNEASSQGASLSFSKVSVYLSNFCFYADGKRIHSAPEPQLVHLCNGRQMLAAIPVGADAFSFALGIDSSIQVKGAMSGNLDPVHGFYWTWQSGYIHAKIEGLIADSLGKTQELIWHIGGYQWPYNSIRNASRPLPQGNSILSLNLNAVLTEAPKREKLSVMLPGAAACKISDRIIYNFSIEPQ